MHGYVCTLGYPISSKNVIAHGISVSEKTMPNIPIKGNYLYKNEDLPELLHGKTQEQDENPRLILQEIRCKNIGKIIIGHLNVNSLHNKFDALESIIKVNIDIFVDESFPMGQFKIDGFSTPFKIDRNKEGGGGRDNHLYQI